MCLAAFATEQSANLFVGIHTKRLSLHFAKITLYSGSELARVDENYFDFRSFHRGQFHRNAVSQQVDIMPYDGSLGDTKTKLDSTTCLLILYTCHK